GMPPPPMGAPPPPPPGGMPRPSMQPMPPMQPAMGQQAPPKRPPSRMSQGMAQGLYDPNKKTVGMNTLMNVVNQVTTRERRRAVKLVIPAVLLLVIGTAAGIWYFRVKPKDIKDIFKEMTPAAWAEVLEPLKSRVYVVLVRTTENGRND